MDESPKVLCAICRVEMILGFRRDMKDGGTGVTEAWIPGEPKRIWFGLAIKMVPAHPVSTFACPKCGLLQSYIDPSQLETS